MPNQPSGAGPPAGARRQPHAGGSTTTSTRFGDGRPSRGAAPKLLSGLGDRACAAHPLPARDTDPRPPLWLGRRRRCRGEVSWPSSAVTPEEPFSGVRSGDTLVSVDVAIRPVERGDFDGVLHLAPRLLVGVDASRPADRVWNAVEGWVRDSLEAAGADDHGGWVAVLEETIVGFVSVAEQDHWCGQADAWVGELIVDERYEGRGIARSLMAKVEDWASARGLTHVRLSTGAANHGARAFYERIGYALKEVTLTRDLRTATFTVVPHEPTPR